MEVKYIIIFTGNYSNFCIYNLFNINSILFFCCFNRNNNWILCKIQTYSIKYKDIITKNGHVFISFYNFVQRSIVCCDYSCPKWIYVIFVF